LQYEPLLEESVAPEAPATEPSIVPPETPVTDPFSEEARAERLNALMVSTLDGKLGRGRSLRYWENLKLKPVHLQMLMAKAAGYSNNAIARQFDYDPARVSVIVNHPDAASVLAHLVSFQAENLLDIKARISAHAGEALDTILTAMRTAPEVAQRAVIGFKLLDRAGYSAVQKSESIHRFEMPADQASALTTALKEAQEVQNVEWKEVPKSGAVVQVGGVGDSEGGEVSVGTGPPDVVEPPHDGQPDLLRLSA
jgi:hypothetical protein